MQTSEVGGLAEAGSIAVAHIRHADKAVTYNATPPADDTGLDSNLNDNKTPSGTEKKSSSFVVGQYGIGGMTMYLGAGQHKSKNDGCSGNRTANDQCTVKETSTTTFAGVRGSVGDTGVSYVFQMRKKKVKNTDNQAADAATKHETNSNSPWNLGASRSLGGGASVHFETGDPDVDKISNSTGVWLKVDF